MEIQPLIYDSTLKALTVRAPWAWAIMAGLKRVENRSWKSSFRGCVAIHAGCSPDSDADAATVFNELQIKSPPNLIRGAIIGLVDLVDILPLDEYLRQYGNDPYNRTFARGPYCWVLCNPQPREPLTCPGNFQLWNVAAALERAAAKKYADRNVRMNK